MLKIGNLKLKSNLILAPMAGISDLPFRMLNRKFGAELCFVEMINCRSISHKSRRTQAMLTSGKEDRPLGVQLLGCEDNFILKALDVLKGYNFDILDFNSACPAKKVIRRGEGCSLMREPKKLTQILKLIVKNSSWPVTVKIRSGWDKGSVNAREVALSAQDCGVSAVFIHGRTKIQGYSGSVDYSVIRKVKKALKIPVIASGDVLSAQLAKKMFDETGCDGLSVARGSLGNPWIFKQIKEFLDKGRVPVSPAINIVVKIMIKHLNASVNLYGEKNGVVLFRKFFSWYTRGFRKVRPLREKSSRAKTFQDMLSIFRDALQGASPHSE
ncbi:MAG: tRNA dihydrouridine synthase DusB [Candidatus Omnitrophica bacterium]|nr:tRNA dihydrouridine synthase DusB [Candidatus Omnitrophota bacterium]